MGTPNSIGTMVIMKEAEITDDFEKQLNQWATTFYDLMSEYLSEPPKFIEIRSYGYAKYDD